MNNGDHPTLADAQALLPDAVLLPVKPGTKGPSRKHWQKTTFADTQTTVYQRILSKASTVSVLLGPPSNWIADLDCDTEPFLEFMLDKNVELQHTLRTRGIRAGGLWFRNSNHTITKVYGLIVSPDSAFAQGGKPDPKTGLVKIGELRCGNGHSLICGLHPGKVNYRWLQIYPLVELDPRSLTWPEEIQDQLPWAARPRGGASADDAPSGALLDQAKANLPIYPILWRHFGFPEAAGNPTNSPFRQDEHPSFSIFDDGRQAYDHSLRKHYDSFDFFQEATGKDPSQAFRPFVTLAGLSSELRGKPKPKTDSWPDHRPLIIHPGVDRYISEFAADLGRILKDHDFYRFHGRAVQVRTVREKAHSGKEYERKNLAEIPPILFAGLIEQYCRPVQDGDFKSIRVETAARTLPLPVFLEQLPIVTLWTDSRIPCQPYVPQMPITLSEPGYDLRTGIYTSPDAPEIDETLSAEEATAAWRALLSEFCFPKEDIERSIAVALAAALTPFCISVLPEKAKRPGFAASANAEGAGKTLLLSFGMVGKLGFVPAGATPVDEDEIRKVIDGAAHYGVPIVFFDNLKGHLSSGALEAFLTTNTWRYRLLGTTNHTEAENVTTVYLTANFATYSADLRRRLLAVELILEEARAEERHIKNYLDEEKLIAMRPKLLSIFWAMVKAWDQKGQPAGSILLPTFESWSRIIGGIVENAGFVSPCLPNNLITGGDTYTRDMEILVSEMVPQSEYRFSDLIDLAYDHHLFPTLISETGSMTPAERSRLGKIVRRFLNRVFGHRYRFCLSGFTRKTERFSVEIVQP
jgi:Bifunctional DNA primase/polymerase, N-terminal